MKGHPKRGRREEVRRVGFNGLVVFNHAGRQLDGATVSLDAPEKIMAAVGEKTYVMYGSGVLSASDVFKALTLDSQFVWVRRLWIWGLYIKGETGMDQAIHSLRAELDFLMNVGGFHRRLCLSSILSPRNTTLPARHDASCPTSHEDQL